ncbi:MAG: mechanosensitive ion channel family protein, partial [Luteimonas sp.]
MQIDRARLLQWLQDMSLDLLGAALILLVGVWLSRRLSRALERGLRRIGADSTVSSFLNYLSYAGLLVVTGIIALQQLSVPVASIVAVLGAAGLAIALAMKDSLSNIAAGIMLVVLRPFREGDYVEVAGREGTVDHIRVFQTRLRTRDNRVLVLPNS